MKVRAAIVALHRLKTDVDLVFHTHVAIRVCTATDRTIGFSFWFAHTRLILLFFKYQLKTTASISLIRANNAASLSSAQPGPRRSQQRYPHLHRRIERCRAHTTTSHSSRAGNLAVVHEADSGAIIFSVECRFYIQISSL